MRVSVKLGTKGQILSKFKFSSALLTSVNCTISDQLKICPRVPNSVLIYSIVNQLCSSPDINSVTLV